MSFRTLMQAGPTKANELFVKLSETSDGAVRTREKLFTELKAELELHTSLEEQHLFPILRRNAETKELVAEAIKDNKELRSKLAELETLPKSDDAFPERLKELQKTFRQHARDEKRELLPAVQRALSEEQVQGVAEKIEAGVVEAERARHDEVEARRAKARQEREQAEQQAEAERAKAAAEKARHEQAEQQRAKARQEREQAERQAEAERAQKAAAEKARHEQAEQQRAKARQEREQAERQAEQEAAAQRAQEEATRRPHEAAEAVARTVTAAPTGVLHIAKTAATGAQRVGAGVRDATDSYIHTVQAMAPNPRILAALPEIAVDAMTNIRSAWLDWMSQTTRAGTQITQDLLRQATEQQRRFAAEAVQGWMAHNARIMQITMRVTQEGFRPFANRPASGHDDRRTGR